MKKLWLHLIFVLLAVSVIATPALAAGGAAASAATKKTAASATQVSPKGKKMAIVGRTGGKAAEDLAIAKHMRGLGFKVTLVDEKKVTVKSLKSYDIVYFSPTMNEKYVKDGQMKGLDVPQI